MQIKRLKFQSHSKDCSVSELYNKDGKLILTREGYAPSIKNFSRGDDFKFEVDNETGKIIGWVPLEDQEIRNAFDLEEDFDLSGDRNSLCEEGGTGSTLN